ncbi:MAG: peptidylprolyl isomerase [Parvularculales bacterium]
MIKKVNIYSLISLQCQRALLVRFLICALVSIAPEYANAQVQLETGTQPTTESRSTVIQSTSPTVSPDSLTSLPREEQGIAVIVNDKLISDYDVEQRLKLIFATAALEHTPENEERIRDQVVRSLINEQIKIQEGSRLEVSINVDDLNEYIDRIANQNDMDTEGLLDFLERKEIDPQTLQHQAYANATWDKLLIGRFGSDIALSDNEINEQYQRMQKAFDKPRYQLGEIFLAFDNARESTIVAQTARRLSQELQRGASFPAIAARFSESPTAAQGGNLGWIQEDQLAPELTRVIRTMRPNSISAPIRASDGYYILALIDKTIGNEADAQRNQFRLMHVLAPLEADASRADVILAQNRINSLLERFTSCENIAPLIEDLNFQIDSVNTIMAGQVDDRQQAILQSKNAGDIIPPQRSPRGIEVVLVCDRQNDTGIAVTRDMIEDDLYNRELEMVARRYLRDLRRSAVVDIR